MLKPFCIAFDGADGSGKTHLTKMAKDYLENLGYKIEIVPMLNGPLRSVILDTSNYYSEEERMVMLRLDAVATTRKILQLISEGISVIIDRSPFSIYAYQGMMLDMYDSICELDESKLKSLRSSSVIKPDMFVFVFRDEKEICMTLSQKEGDHFENKGASFISEVQRVFISFLEEHEGSTGVTSINNTPLASKLEVQFFLDQVLESIEFNRNN